METRSATKSTIAIRSSLDDREKAPAEQTRVTLPNHTLTIALVGLAVGFILLVALNMN